VGRAIRNSSIGFVDSDRQAEVANTQGSNDSGHPEAKEMIDPVRPDYYVRGGIEVVDAAEAWGLDKDAYLFSVLKYIARAGKKDPAKLIEDLEKAVWYLSRRIQRLKLNK
jgi:hypothetical protein